MLGSRHPTHPPEGKLPGSARKRSEAYLDHLSSLTDFLGIVFLGVKEVNSVKISHDMPIEKKPFNYRTWSDRVGHRLVRLTVSDYSPSAFKSTLSNALSVHEPHKFSY
jgi:hypothetical protein